MVAPQGYSLRRRHFRLRARQDSGSSGVVPPDNPDVGDDSSSQDDVDGDIADEVVASILSSQAIEYSKSLFGTSSTSSLDTPSTSSTSSTVEAVTTTTTSTTSSTSSTSQTTPTSTTPPTTTTKPTTSSSSAATSTASVVSSNEQSSAKKGGASPAVIGVVVTLMLLMAAAAILFFVRRRFIRKREAKRATWNAQPYMEKNDVNVEEFVEKDDGSNGHSDHFQDIDANEKKGATPIEYPFAIGAQGSMTGQQPEHIQQLPLSRNGAPMPVMDLPQPPPPLHPSGFAPFRAPSPPPMEEPQDHTPAPVGFDGPALGANPPIVSFNAFSTVASPPSSVLAPGLTFNNAAGTSADSARRQTGTLLTVIRTFMPSLPDELPVQPGEQVRLIEKYDDGWAFCERLRGGAGMESGVVPVECLDGLPQDSSNSSVGRPGQTENIGVSLTRPVQGMGMVQERVDSWRLSKRRSSLHPVGAGKY